MTAPIPGRLLTEPVNRRGRLRITPVRDNRSGRTKALRVRVDTELGLNIVDVRVTESEVTVVDYTDAAGTLQNAPGAFWFYGEYGSEVGFLADQNAGVFTKPNATERPRKGHHEPARGEEDET